MNTQITKSLVAGLTAYGVENQEVATKLTDVFGREKSFLDKVSDFDEVVDEYPEIENLREVFFDLLILNFFAEDTKKLEDDYLESEEWEQIEDETIDRGTEMLNLFLYLRECKDEKIQPSLDDYLTEFLLVDESEFQDEHQIYESIIANQILMESDYEEISKVTAKIGNQDEMGEYFYVIMGFFLNPNPTDADQEEFSKYAPDELFDTALYQILISYLKA